MVGALQRLNYVITAVVLPSSTQLGPRSRGLHSHTGGPPEQVLASLEGGGPVRDARFCDSRKLIFGTGTPKSTDFRSFFLFLRSHRPPIPPLGCVLWGHFPRSLLAPSRLPPRFLLGVQERRSAKKRFTNVRPPNVAPSRIRLSFTKGASSYNIDKN